jgi:hypothetical protein
MTPPSTPDKLKIADIIVGDLAEPGNWLVANVETSIPWPTSISKVNFRGHVIFLAPKTSTTYPFVAVKLPPSLTYKDGQKLISHFLSSLAWVEGYGIAVSYWTGGSRPHPMGFGSKSNVVTSQFELDYLPDTTDERRRWALAFFREGLSLRNNVAYAALSFFKIINLFADTGSKQKAWINANVDNLKVSNAVKFENKKRLDELRNSGITDIGDYLYADGRCAIAHAGESPTVDPENPNDLERLSKDLPLIRALAAHAIEQELGIKSRHTVWEEHLYELDGFKKAIGATISEKLGRGEAVAAHEITGFFKIHLKIADQPAHEGLVNLNVQIGHVDSGVVRLSCASDNRFIRTSIALNFPDERIIFDLGELSVGDDGTAAAARQIAAVVHFIVDYLCNGKLQVWDANSGQMLGRRDAFIPVNIDFSRTLAHYRTLIEKYEAEAVSREAPPQ